MGKSTLLRKVLESYPKKGQVFIDINNLPPLKTAVEFLYYFAEHAEGLKETQKALQKLTETYQSTRDLISPYEEILKDTVQMGVEEHEDELD